VRRLDGGGREHGREKTVFADDDITIGKIVADAGIVLRATKR